MKPRTPVKRASAKWLAKNPDLARAGKTVRSSSPVQRSASGNSAKNRKSTKRKSKPSKRKAIRVKKRSASEFARIYGSRARVRWVKTLDCVGCGKRGESVNAHSETGGMGYKAGCETIVPLCHNCHGRYDRHEAPFQRPYARLMVQAKAKMIAAAWDVVQASSVAGGA